MGCWIESDFQNFGCIYAAFSGEASSVSKAVTDTGDVAEQHNEQSRKRMLTYAHVC
jgi:hypothetical protein